MEPPKMGSGKGLDPGTPGFCSLLFLVPKKNGKSSPVIDLSLLNLYKESTVQNGDSQVSTAIGTSQQLGCLDRSDRCLSTCFGSFSFKEVSSFCFRQLGLPIYSTTIRNVPKTVDFHQTYRHNRC